MLTKQTTSTNPVAVTVVIPCYRVKAHVLDVIAAIPTNVSNIICVDDGCPDHSGKHVETACLGDRVVVLYHDRNQGVGGAMATGYRAALATGATIVVKVDGDGQMDPRLLPAFVTPIVEGVADYTKGNRFYRPESVIGMPLGRLVGNAVLSFVSKFSTGYWNVFDPNNGYTAIHADVLRQLPLGKLSKGYFFESDLLFRLSTVRAVVLDIPMDALYAKERSNLSIGKILGPFLFGHIKNFLKRLAYNYYLRDFNIASIEWILGPALIMFGVVFGLSQWVMSSDTGMTASAGTVMLSALPIIVGVQMLLSAINFDVQNVPRRAMHLDIGRWTNNMRDWTGASEAPVDSPLSVRSRTSR
jgi:glycosyltransferase involved in cell wall biosynthesis